MVPTKKDTYFGGRLLFVFVCFIALIIVLAISGLIAVIGAVVSRILWSGLLVRLYELIFGYFGSYGSGWVMVSMADLHPQVHFWGPKIVSILGAVGALTFVPAQFYGGNTFEGFVDFIKPRHPVATFGLVLVLLPFLVLIAASAILIFPIGRFILAIRSFLSQKPLVSD